MQHCYLCNAAIPDGTGLRMRVKVGDSDNFGISWSRHPHARSSHRTQFGERLVCAACAKSRRRSQSVGSLITLGLGTIIEATMCSHQPSPPPQPSYPAKPAPPPASATSATPAKPIPATAAKQKPAQLTAAQQACMKKAVAENTDLARCK